MSTETKWHSKWWATGLLFPIAATAIYDWIKEKPIFTTLASCSKWLYTDILLIFTFRVQIWQVGIFLLVLILGFYLYDKFINSEKYDFLYDYKSDRLKKWKWNWDYDFNDKRNEYTIRDLQPECPNCQVSMVEYSRSWDYGYECPKCERIYLSGEAFFEEKQHAAAMISDKIRKMQTSTSKD